MEKLTQTEKVLAYIKDYGSISTWQAFTDLGITRLASRICDIEKSGVRVERQTEVATNRYGDKVHYTRYSLKGE